MEKAAGRERAEGQQHPIAIYLWIWALLFVFSTFSYLIDYFHLHGYLRWSLIITFMLLKAGLIVAIFMHMAWERLALKFAILVPPLVLLILIGLMAVEGDYTFITRLAVFMR
ncbi:MAG: cytochrome C oxidase subunit IV [Gammaproteobacteria bacterium]|nr:MAG: cytochrome C oxidase subunit IV [Gammaproteobacteria bacterium]